MSILSVCPIKVIVASSLINREWLKQGRCSKAKWVRPKYDEIYPCLEVPLYSAVWVVASYNHEVVLFGTIQ